MITSHLVFRYSDPALMSVAVLLIIVSLTLLSLFIGICDAGLSAFVNIIMARL